MDDATKQYLDLMHGSIKEKIDDVKTDITADINGLRESQSRGFGKINGRVRRLEIRNGWIIGVGSCAVFCIGLYLKFG